MGPETPSRRPVAARGSRWAVAAAAWLGRYGVRPNQVSVLGLVSAALAGLCLVVASRAQPGLHALLFLVAAGLIELRLLCNLLDGMIAVEGGKGTKTGPVFNELPDRFSDAVVLVCAGYAAQGGVAAALGWGAAVMALMAAYVRALAGSLGATQDFGGPMAKQRRMEVISLACLLGGALAGTGWSGRVLTAALVVVISGAAVTAGRRTARLLRELESR